MGTINKKVEIQVEKLQTFCEQYQIQELAIFGSVLGDNFSEISDIDLLVEFKPEAEIGFVELSKMQRELSLIFKREVDLVPKKGLKTKIRDSVIASAEILYAA